MATKFGIHMGNSTICLSILKEGKIEIVPSKFGDRTSCAAIAAAENNEFVIGMPAVQGLVRNGPLTVINNFQFLNEDITDDDFDKAVKNCVCKVNRTPLEYDLTKDDVSTTVTPYEVAVKLLSNCYENASQAAKSEKCQEAVITVPLNFSINARNRLAEAAKEAGFDLLQMLSDPAAALLAYEIGFDIMEKSTVLIYRLGGISCTISIFTVEQGLYEALDSVHLSNLGGNLLTNSLAQYIAGEFFNKYKLDPQESRRTMTKLIQHAENGKHVLSTMPLAHIFIESLMDGIDWSQQISRARFENIISSQIASFIRPIEELIAKHNNIKIDKIIVCGGSMKIPKLQSSIANLFPDAQLLNTIPPDEILSIGCARQSSFVTDAWDPDGEHIEMDIQRISKDIFVESNGNNEKITLFEKYSQIPINTTFSVKPINGKVSLKFYQDDVLTNNIDYDCPGQDIDVEEFDVKAKISQLHHGDKQPVINLVFPSEKLIN